MPLLPNSPCLEAGSNPANLSFDQRGTGFARSFGKPDIGDYERVTEEPIGSPTLSNITVPGSSIYTFSVGYFDNLAVDVGSIKAREISLSQDQTGL